MGKYDDIIHTPWPRPTKRARMSLEDRAAQFAPFAALTGYDAVLAETARLTQNPVFLTEESLEELNAQLRLAQARQDEQPKLQMTVYYEDERKAGGRFETITGNLKKIDLYRGGLILTDGREIPFFRICDFRLEEPEENQ